MKCKLNQFLVFWIQNFKRMSSLCSFLNLNLLPYGIIGAIGSTLNLMCVVCFTQLCLEAKQATQRQQRQPGISNMLCCLLLKSIFDALCSLINLAAFIFMPTPSSLTYNVYSLYFSNFCLYTLGNSLRYLNFINI